MRQPVRGTAVRLKGLSRSGTWPSGNPRLYLRRAGEKTVPMPDAPMHSPRFLAAYVAAQDGKDIVQKPRTGSIAAAVVSFLASDEYLGKAATTRAVWRRGLDDIRKRYGAALLSDLAEKHIRLDLARLKPNPANQRLKIWRAACAWWVDVGLCQSNPAKGIDKRKTAKTEGHTPWTAADVAKFRDHWPIGTDQRLAFEILHWTGCRMSDAVKLSDANMAPDGWLIYRQQKTGGWVAIPLTAPAPDFAEPDGMVEKCLAVRRRHFMLLTTAHGAPRSGKAASAWFSAAARAAGVEKTAHGLRKTRAEILANNGASAHQIGAWLGHESLSETQRYAANYDRRKMLEGPDREQVISNFGEKLENGA